MRVRCTFSRGVCLSLALASGPGCGDGGANAGFTPPPVTVEAQTVEARPLRDVATFSGQLSAESSVVLKAETEGVIEAIPLQEGQRASRGEVLIRLKDAEQRARLREAEANLSLARERFDRTEELATRSAVSLAQKDQAVAELEVAAARVELAKLELERTRIRAPFDGVLGVRLVAIGDRVDQETPLVQIDAVDRLQVVFSISEIGILFTRVGAPVEVRVAPYPDSVFRGEVFYVSPTLDPATRRVVAKAWVPNEDHRLRAGLFATVDMLVDQRESAILVPEAAVFFDREGSYVWKLDADDVPTRVPVQTGLRREGLVEVTLGVVSGDRIVTAGTHKVTEGKRVIAETPRPASAGQASRRSARGAGEGT